MAILTDADRAEVWRDFQQQLSNARDPLGTLTKADLRAAVNAIDSWVSDNGAAMNTAIPQPARAQLTTAQKARLFSAVVLRRFTQGV